MRIEDVLKAHGVGKSGKLITKFSKPEPYNAMLNATPSKNITDTNANYSVDCIAGDHNDNFILFRWSTSQSNLYVYTKSGSLIATVPLPRSVNGVAYGLKVNNKKIYFSYKGIGSVYYVSMLDIGAGYTGGSWVDIHSTSTYMRIYNFFFDIDGNVFIPVGAHGSGTCTVYIKSQTGVVVRQFDMPTNKTWYPYTFIYCPAYNAISMFSNTDNKMYVYRLSDISEINNYSTQSSKYSDVDRFGRLHTIARPSSQYVYARRDFLTGGLLVTYSPYSTGSPQDVLSVACMQDGDAIAVMNDGNNNRVVFLFITQTGVGSWSALSFSALRYPGQVAFTEHGNMGFVIGSEGYALNGYITKDVKLGLTGDVTLISQFGKPIHVKETDYWTGEWSEIESGKKYTFTANTLIHYNSDIIAIKN